MPSERQTVLVAVLFAVLTAATGFAAVGAAAPTAPGAAPAVGSASFQADEPNATTNATGTSATRVTVSATGQVSAQPDQALVFVSSTTTADDPANATARLAENVSSMRAALLAANLSADRIVTISFNVFQQTEGEPPNATTQFVASQGFEITLDDVNRTGEMIDVALENGATEVDGVTFTLSESSRADLRNRALAEAMANGRSQAETVAGAENLTLVGVRSISTANGDVQPLQARGVAEAAPTGTRIDAGPVTVIASVVVTYDASEGATGNVTAAGNETAAGNATA